MAQSLSLTTSAVDGIDTLTFTVEYVSDALLKVDVAVNDATVNQVISETVDVSKIVAMSIGSDQDMTLKTNGTDEVERISTTGTVTAGTFTLTYSGQTTGNIAYNATASAVQTALEALSNIAVGDVSCSGGPLPGTPVDVTFTGNLAATNVTQMTSTDTLTGGSTSISTTTAGVAAADTLSLVANLPIVWTTDSVFSCPLTVDVVRFLVSNGSGTNGTIQFRILTES